ncbi:hypothetical protein CBR_g54982 [Chara braunii]|uniref:Uncharacterized protein n=1 Tax=Chara braunii TaxID=69332 RepID=A0A388K7T6_CHABU|nr:hypothetical protein CBR_g54982 [Chara braunii]|eukprot:GBG66003.1 hypothetical protein CBR_g54982 [Chara braunii]
MEARRREERARQKWEKAEAARLEAEEQENCEKWEAGEKERIERKVLKKKEKQRKEAERRAEMRKDLGIQMRMEIQGIRQEMRHELRDELIETFKEAVLPATLPRLDKGKMKTLSVSGSDSQHSEEESDTRLTQEITEKANQLSKPEKRKRGSEPVFEDSLPMKLPPKRTPKRVTIKPPKLCARLTKSKAKQVGTKKLSQVKTPLSRRKTCLKKTTPLPKSATKGSLARLRFKNKVRLELKDLDATKLQRICKEEGVPYDKKVEAIFDIVERRAIVAFRDEAAANEEIIHLESETCKEPVAEGEQ